MNPTETPILNFKNIDLTSHDLESNRSHLNSLNTLDSNSSSQLNSNTKELPKIQILKTTDPESSNSNPIILNSSTSKPSDSPAIDSCDSSKEAAELNLNFYSDGSEKNSSFLLSPSFNYTKSEQSVSGLDSFMSSNLLMLSFPGYENEEIRGNRKSLKNACATEAVDAELIGKWDEWRERSRQEKEEIMSEMISCIYEKNEEGKEGSLLFEIGNSPISDEIEVKNRLGCGCSGCVIL